MLSLSRRLAVTDAAGHTQQAARVAPRLRSAAAAILSAVLLAACGGGGSGSADTGTAKSGSLMDSLGDTLRTALGVSRIGTVATTQLDAVRLANQATFGADEALVANIRSMGPLAWVTSQVTLRNARYTSGGDGQIHAPESGSFCDGRGDTCWRDYYSTEPLEWDFYRNATTQPDQLRQRVAFALAQILVVSAHEVAGTYGWRHYHNMLLDNALGNYREVLRRVTLSPMMGEYLDHVNNDKDAPNENYGRELLQLFSLGTCKLNIDGSLAGGSCQPTYDNATVRNYAHALTGWTYPAGGSSPWGCWPEGANCRYLGADMVAQPLLADNQARALLSNVTVPASRTPAQALNLVLDSLMSHPNLAPFIARQLIQHLVTSNPSKAYVQRVAQTFIAGRYRDGSSRARSDGIGTGQRGDLAATVAAILLDAEARQPTSPVATEKLREPVLMVTGALRALNGTTDGEALGWWWGEELRQHIFNAPSVFSFYPPDYPVPGTALVGPAFGVLNANTTFARLNYLNQLLYWGGMDASGTVPNGTGTHVKLDAFLADAGSPSVLVDRISNLATGGSLSASARSQVVTAVSAWPTNDPNINWRLERVRTAAYLVLASPAFQVLN